MSILIFLGILISLVIIHEFGHFLVAKLFKVRVEEFGVGYPPRALTFGRWGETEYTLNWIPFGGFVRLLGEDKGAGLTDEEKKRAFLYAFWWKKALILIAGVAFNVLAACIVFTLAASYGAPIAIDEGTELATKSKLMITNVYEATPAATAGFKPGDVVIGASAGEELLKEFVPSKFSEFTSNHGGEHLRITVRRGEESETIDVTPSQGILDGAVEKPAIGVTLGLVLQEPTPIIQVIPLGLRETKDWFIEVVLGLWNLIAGSFTGTAKISDVSGPVGIATHVGEWYQLGIAHLLYFIGIISINLAVINLIPIPALDGGRLLFVLVEAVIRRPIPEQFGNVVNSIGFLALVALMVIVTYNDVLKLVQG